jgi:uncharacterized membrane protein
MTTTPRKIGNWIAPARFIGFILLFPIAGLTASRFLDFRIGWMIGFDLAAIVFLVSCFMLFRHGGADEMRQHARENDANRTVLLVVTVAVSLAVMATIGAEVMQSGRYSAAMRVLIVGTLIIVWLFANTIYAFHYAHLSYLKDEGPQGVDFPGTTEPDYWDFAYFSFTLGMTFQTSDVSISDPRIRRVVLWHCFAAFVFNLGILAFTINVLGSSS